MSYRKNDSCSKFQILLRNVSEEFAYEYLKDYKLNTTLKCSCIPLEQSSFDEIMSVKKSCFFPIIKNTHFFGVLFFPHLVLRL